MSLMRATEATVRRELLLKRRLSTAEAAALLARAAGWHLSRVGTVAQTSAVEALPRPIHRLVRVRQLASRLLLRATRAFRLLSSIRTHLELIIYLTIGRALAVRLAALWPAGELARARPARLNLGECRVVQLLTLLHHVHYFTLAVRR